MFFDLKNYVFQKLCFSLDKLSFFCNKLFFSSEKQCFSIEKHCLSAINSVLRFITHLACHTDLSYFLPVPFNPPVSALYWSAFTTYLVSLFLVSFHVSYFFFLLHEAPLNRPSTRSLSSFSTHFPFFSLPSFPLPFPSPFRHPFLFSFGFFAHSLFPFPSPFLFFLFPFSPFFKLSFPLHFSSPSFLPFLFLFLPWFFFTLPFPFPFIFPLFPLIFFPCFLFHPFPSLF